MKVSRICFLVHARDTLNISSFTLNFSRLFLFFPTVCRTRATSEYSMWNVALENVRGQLFESRRETDWLILLSVTLATRWTVHLLILHQILISAFYIDHFLWVIRRSVTQTPGPRLNHTKTVIHCVDEMKCDVILNQPVSRFFWDVFGMFTNLQQVKLNKCMHVVKYIKIHGGM